MESIPSGNDLIFHVDTTVSQCPEMSFYRHSTDIQGFKSIGEIGEQIVRKLLELNGVSEVTISSYKICLTKGKAFNFEFSTLCETICGIIKNEINPNLKLIEGEKGSEPNMIIYSYSE